MGRHQENGTEKMVPWKTSQSSTLIFLWLERDLIWTSYLSMKDSSTPPSHYSATSTTTSPALTRATISQSTDFKPARRLLSTLTATTSTWSTMMSKSETSLLTTDTASMLIPRNATKNTPSLLRTIWVNSNMSTSIFAKTQL